MSVGASYCCAACFGDRGLRRNIIPLYSVFGGVCTFCGSSVGGLIEPRQLATVFEVLISIYEPDPDGKLLVEWMKEDWQLFTHPRMDVAHAKELLAEILDDGDVVRENFSPSKAYKSEGLTRWETLRDELMFRNRYFLDKPLDTDRLRDLLAYLHAEELPLFWHRSRVLHGNTPYSIAEMGAPPKHLATHGRANPAGIPYLYLSSLPETAISEIRPHTGETVCVAKFLISDPIVAIDLRNPRELVSPFLLSDANEIGQLRADIPFLERLGSELTRPVLPRSAAIDYLPSQYLCEFIKKSGYDGVVYRSSVGNGINLALFDPLKATCTGVSVHDVTKVSVTSNRR